MDFINSELGLMVCTDKVVLHLSQNDLVAA